MRVTVGQLSEPSSKEFSREWAILKKTAQKSDLVLLPEMPFSDWLPATRAVDPDAWRKASEQHALAANELPELGAGAVAYTQPESVEQKRFNQGVIWQSDYGVQPVHRKAYIPDEDEVWEATWYDAGEPTHDIFHLGEAKVAFMICTELWFPESARHYGDMGVHLILAPRATGPYSLPQWLSICRVISWLSGAYVLSANRAGNTHGHFGGASWIVGPDGNLLAETNHNHPAFSLDLDLALADGAKTNYPRYTAP